ncbi:MAG: M48 family metallopeptidase [Candidatus Jordarchaeum sp.]|uniref:M48 family metallopeptidase n=1 Tax=Candidatus Jordarchaeum sp. TaxID=2823881 RepID=UPI00404B4F0B
MQSILGGLVLLMPFISLIICKTVKEDAYSIKTKIWLFTLFLPIVFIPLRFLISQIYLLSIGHPISPMFENIYSTGFLTYCVFQLIITCFVFLFMFKGIKSFSNRKDVFQSKLVIKSNENFNDYGQLKSITKRLARLMDIDMPEIFVLKFESPIMFTVDESKEIPLIVVSNSLIDLLDEQELEACLGHELAHIMNNDRFVRKTSSFLRAVMFYNPFAYFIEPVIYREREFLADKISSRITKKPEALASALIKIAENAKDARLLPKTVMCFFNNYRFLIRKHPPLEERLKRLMRMIEIEEFL